MHNCFHVVHYTLLYKLCAGRNYKVIRGIRVLLSHYCSSSNQSLHNANGKHSSIDTTNEKNHVQVQA